MPFAVGGGLFGGWGSLKSVIKSLFIRALRASWYASEEMGLLAAGVGVVGVLLGRCMVVGDTLVMGVRLTVEIFERARGPVGGLKGWYWG